MSSIEPYYKELVEYYVDREETFDYGVKINLTGTEIEKANFPNRIRFADKKYHMLEIHSIH